MKLLSNFISYFCHPLCLPTYIFLALFYWIPNSYVQIPYANKAFVMWSTVLGTLILPSLGTLALYVTGSITSLELADRQERTYPFMLTSIAYSCCAFGLYYLHEYIGIEVFGIIVMSAISVICVTIISFFWKISVHAVGIGGVCGLFLFFGFTDAFEEIIIPVCITFFGAGMVLGARLYLKAHSNLEVYIGFLLGFMIHFFLSLFLMPH